jgi:peptide-methionine (S)-S-oxide reductase
MTTNKLILLILAILAAGLALWALPSSDGDAPSAAEAASADDSNLTKATFAGGCFWCMEPPYDKLDGVVATTSGYIDGHVDNPTYKQVSSGATGHTEAVQVTYDPEKVSYAELLEVFWHNIDPTVDDRQFCDWGDQYRTGIYAHDEEQLRLAEKSKQDLIDSGRFEHVTTDVKPAPTFYPAEEYHQDFYEKNPGHYKSYRNGCGRDRRLQELWGEG